ncbi:hypothetical protein BP6252_10816 [Coleophoma cylindrospora]|uniref:Tachykinin family protein n=1 Tax=Coleophoma cylindrospora TaxID=1849047 RepID=A0A3D8QNH4_9HELO|nr:hypothetical protein BP6252_10816 [Coleophoma cylindrospora]
MTGTTRESRPPSSNIVIFDTSSSTPFYSKNSILISCRGGPPKLTGIEKRGRPRKERQTSPCGEYNEELEINENSSTSKFSFVTYTASPQNAGPKVRTLVRRRAMLNYRRQERDQKSGSEEAEKSRANFPASHLFPRLKKVDDGEDLLSCAADGRLNFALPKTTNGLLPRGITAIEPFNAFPIKIEPYMLELLSSYTTFIYETMYTIEKHVNLNPARDYWLPMAFQDAALLHAFIFCAYGHSTISQGRKESPAAVIHLRKAIQIVNERLRAPVPSITDATIAVVCTFAHTEIFNCNHENWRVHMRGLKQMLQQRGGIHAFESNRLVRSKINRADLCGSIDAVQNPYFELVVTELSSTPEYHQTTTITATGFCKITNSIKLDEALTQIFCQLQDITINLNMFHHHKAQLHPLSLREAITSSQYSLLNFKLQQGNATHQNSIHELLRLGLLAYLVTLLNESPPGVALYDILGAKLKSTLIEIKQNGGINLEFSLWIVFLAASIVEGPDIKDYFMATAIEIIEELGVFCWDNVEALLKSFFWVEKIHRGTLRPIWTTLKALITDTRKEQH